MGLARVHFVCGANDNGGRRKDKETGMMGEKAGVRGVFVSTVIQRRKGKDRLQSVRLLSVRNEERWGDERANVVISSRGRSEQ